MCSIYWYKLAQASDIYEELAKVGVSFSGDGTINIYHIDDNGDIDFSRPPQVLDSIDDAILQQTAVHRAIQDDAVKYLAFLDDLVFFVQKLNSFPIFDIPQSTEGAEDIVAQDIVAQGIDEDELEMIISNDTVSESELDKINKPYPYMPTNYKISTPEYGYWFYPFDIDNYDKKNPQDVVRELWARNVLEHLDNDIPDSPSNVDIANMIDRVLQGSGDTEDLANAIRSRYVIPLRHVKSEDKQDIRKRFELLADICKRGRFPESLNVINVATRIRMEHDIKQRCRHMLNIIERRISLLNKLPEETKPSYMPVARPIAEIERAMSSYKVQRQGNQLFRVTKPNGVTYYVDVVRKTCTCPWGRKVSPYRQDASGCKHYRYVLNLLKGGITPTPV